MIPPHRPCLARRSLGEGGSLDRSLHAKHDVSERGDGNQLRLRAKGFGENPVSITFVSQDITNWKKERNSNFFLKDRDHLSEKWETLNPHGTKTHFEFDLMRSKPDEH